MPVLITEAPASSTLRASVTVSSQVWPSGTRSSSDIRYITRKSSPSASRTRRTTSTGKRIRFSARAAPPVGAVVGVRREELVDQVALGPHDLDAVVPGAPGQPGRVDEVVDGPLDPARDRRAGLERRDRRLGRGRRDVERGVAVAAGVQHLQRDRAALGVHRVGDLPVPRRRAGARVIIEPNGSSQPRTLGE